MIKKYVNGNLKRQLIFILLSFGLFSLSRGLWYNYQTLWMQSNSLSVTTVSIVTGLASLLSVSVVFIFSNLVRRKDLKKVVSMLIFLKLLIMVLLFYLNGSNFSVFIKFFIMADLVLDTYISINMYPVISLVQKGDIIYSVHGIINSSFYNCGVLFGGLFLGKVLFHFSFSYNTFLFLSLFFLFCSFYFLINVSVQPESISNDEQSESGIEKLILFMKNDVISKLFILYIFFTNFTFYAIAGLKMILLTEVVLFEANFASMCLLAVGILGNFVAVLVLKYFTSKKYWVNVMVKFGGRCLFCALAFLTNNIYMMMGAIFYALIFSDSYSHVTEAPYINRVPNDIQLSFINLKGMVSYLGNAIGIWVCGLFLAVGIRYLFLVVFVVFCVQIALMLLLGRILAKE